MDFTKVIIISHAIIEKDILKYKKKQSMIKLHNMF